MNLPKWFSKISRMGLAWKISFAMVAIITLTGIASITVMESTMAHYLYAEHDAKAFSIAKNLAANAAEPLLLDNITHVQLLLKNTLAAEKDIIYAFIANNDARVIAHTFTGGFPKDLLKVHHHKPGETMKHEVIETEYGIIHDIAVPVLGGEMGYLHLGLSHRSVSSQIARVRKRILTIIILISCSAIFFSFILSRLATRPLLSLSIAAENIGKGNLGFRAKIKGNDEISALAGTFNNMADQLQEDIKKRIEMENALQKSETLYRSLVENIDLGVTLIDRDFTILMANTAQGRLFGKAGAVLVGKKCYREFEKRNGVCSHCPGEKTMETKEPQDVTTEWIRDDGSRFTVRIRTFPVFDQQDEPSGFIEVVEDITHRQKIEDELQRSKKIESIGVLAGGIAHDFNNLLTGIIGNISLASELCKGQENVLCKRLHETEKAAMRARDLTQQLLTFSTGGAPILSLTDMRKLIKESVEFYLSGSSIHCIYEMDDDLLFASVDSGQISQVIQNMVTNAREAMPDGGTIKVSAHNIALTEDSPVPLPPGRYIQLSISDHGEGIAEEDLPRVFDPYFSTRDKGSGLGLSICYSIIKRHKGHIAVESKKGTGTTFDIYLRASRETPTPAAEQTDVVSGSGHILVMDDEEMVRDLSEQMLKNLGYTVEVSRNGEEALALYRESLDNGKRFDIVLMDLTIQGGMGGKETITKLLKMDPGVKAIVTSGYSNDPVMSEPGKYGFTACIEKPYSIRKLSTILNEVMHG